MQRGLTLPLISASETEIRKLKSSHEIQRNCKMIVSRVGKICTELWGVRQEQNEDFYLFLKNSFALNGEDYFQLT